jgi:phosphoribosylformimino-5-aminoimidazole carboxamide ribotide isomerase
MILIIPSIPIVHGVCGAQIASLAHEIHHADRDIYSQDPIDRARLLRKENAKMLHLQFIDADPWKASGIELIRRMHEAIDIPIGISYPSMPPTEEECTLLYATGAFRIFLPLDTPESVLFHLCSKFTSRRIIPTVDLTFDFAAKLPEYKSHKIERLAIDISPSDQLDSNVIEWEQWRSISELANSHTIRLTALHGIRGYPELNRLQQLGGALDSLVLCRALNENRFPCQLIWREMEAAFAFEQTPASNLWSNPLEGKPHI